MVFRLRREPAQDEEPPQEGRGVPYKLASYEHDHEGKRFKSSDVVYSFWSAAKYTLILSLVLWWLPLFGQMIAGYVGGRRAGGPWKGVAAAIIPVACLYVVMTGFDSGFFPSHVSGVAIAPAAVGASIADSIPFISPYIHFSSEYVGSFVDSLAGSSPYGINVYIVTVAFAYVGGILAEQSRREIEFSSGSVMSNTTVLVSDQTAHAQRLHPYPEPSRPGLAHTIASHLPWSHEHASHQHVYALPPSAGQHGWGRAYEASFREAGEEAEDCDPRPERRRAACGGAHAKGAVKRRGVKGDARQRPKRRVKQHYSSARRFVPPDEGTPRRPPARRSRGHSSSRGSRAQHQRSVDASGRFAPQDKRSVRRARRRIDREWTVRQPRRARSYSQAPVGLFDGEEEDGIVAPRTADEGRHKHHAPSPGHRWDMI
ncbi:MAG: hypothetical protein JSV90_06180 [Methanobacteriota archaeon]|nr:MAG: hypothetical protein JSV90_06180 [Euryarchaeota archaeon]